MVPTMLKRLDRIRFRGRRDEFLDLAESPNTSDTECSEEIVIKPRASVRETEEVREAEVEPQGDAQVQKHTEKISIFTFFNVMLLIMFSSALSKAGPGSFSAALDDRTDLNEVKGHLEIALLEKHYLREYSVNFIFIRQVLF